LNSPVGLYLGICAVLILNYIFLPVSGGENQYLLFAWQWWDPQLVPDSFTLSEFPGSRWLFQVLVGPLVSFCGFEMAVVSLRLLSYTLVSWPLMRVFRYWKFNWFNTLLIIQIFISSQSFMGKEWMIGTFEPKTVAYIFIFYGLLYLMKGKYLLTALFTALAAYFHIIVGGWFLIASALFIWFNEGFLKAFKSGVLFILLLVPFLIYLIPVYLSAVTQVGEYSANYIYVYYRLPHHLGIFKSLDYFFQYHLSGSILTIAGFLGSMTVWHKTKYKKVALLAAIALGINLVFIGVSAVDAFILEKSGSLGLRYYPFRLNSIGVFLVAVWVGFLLRNIKAPKLPKQLFPLLSCVVIIGFLIGNVQKGLRKTEKFQSNESYFELTEWVKSNTKKREAFLLDWGNINHSYYYSFSRFTLRENYSVFKFIPADKLKIYPWFGRQSFLTSLQRGSTTYKEVLANKEVDYIISEKPNNEPDLKLYYQNKGYYVYGR